MLIDFIQYQQQQFDAVALQLIANADTLMCFDHVADFYQAPWLDLFPKGTTWQVTGLDDGAEEFYAIIAYKNHYLSIDCAEKIILKMGRFDLSRD